jgi:DNA-binding transcriptional MocR family regulator
LTVNGPRGVVAHSAIAPPDDLTGLRDNGPLARTLYQHFRERIMAGDYAVGGRLPTVRAVANEVRSTPETVAAAYRMLAAEGVVRMRTGAGTVVVSRPGTTVPTGVRAATLVPALGTPSYHETYRRLLQLDREAGDAAFASYILPPQLFVPGLDRLLRRVASRNRNVGLEMGAPQGEERLRSIVARRLQRVGATTAAENVVVTNGAQEGLGLVFRALVAPGDTVVVESPTYLGALDALATLGARVVGVPMGPEGADLDVLEATVARARPKVFYTMPTHQNPTGLTMPEVRRLRLLALARRYDFIILEDGSSLDLGYDGPTPVPLLGLDRDRIVVHVGTFSKTIASGIRIGYVVAPGPLVEPLLRLKYVSNIHTSVLLQHLVCEVMLGAHWRRHLVAVHRQCRARRDAMLAALDRALPGRATWTFPAGGFSVWVWLDPELDAADLFRLAIDRGVSFVPGAVFFPGDVQHHTLRLCFSTTSLDVIDRGVGVLAKALAELGHDRNRIRQSLG